MRLLSCARQAEGAEGSLAGGETERKERARSYADPAKRGRAQFNKSYIKII